jgi:hypothetical protein
MAACVSLPGVILGVLAIPAASPLSLSIPALVTRADQPPRYYS